ncbi:NAD(P)H-hydrate dehydratase [Anaerolineales bacterium]
MLKRIVSVEQMRSIENEADQSGLSFDQMMENAGKALAELIQSYILPDKNCLFLIGAGNNGGDGLVAAYYTAINNPSSTIYIYFYKDRNNNLLVSRLKSLANIQQISLARDEAYDHLKNYLENSQIIVDAFLGIGFKPPLREKAQAFLGFIQQSLNSQSVKPLIIACDCPSGIECNTGAVENTVLKADISLNFIAYKYGLFLAPALEYTGHLELASAGIEPDFPALQAHQDILLDPQAVANILPLRELNTNKGSFGKCLIIAGSNQYVGAIGLSATAVYRCGAGLVTVVASVDNINRMAASVLEATWLTQENYEKQIEELRESYDAWLIGPGLGVSENSQHLVLISLKYLEKPILIDADALNILAEQKEWWQLVPPHSVLTPHPGEMARLSKLSIKDIQANRIEITREYAQKWSCVLVLKGAHTVIANPQGQVSVLPFKDSSLAKAGTGDVLSGMIASFLTQGIAPYQAAQLGAYVHGLSAQLADHKRSLLASDLLSSQLLDQVFKRLEDSVLEPKP